MQDAAWRFSRRSIVTVTLNGLFDSPSLLPRDSEKKVSAFFVRYSRLFRYSINGMDILCFFFL